MNRLHYFISALLFVTLCACHTESVYHTHPFKPIHFTLSRSISNDSLPIGSKALFNIQGGLHLKDEVFTLTEVGWTNRSFIKWSDKQQEATYTVLYPTYENNRYSEINLYANGELEDILIAQDTLTYTKNIQLQFKHLFAQLSIHIQPTLLSSIKAMRLTIPHKIETISTSDGIFSITESTHTVEKQINENEYYTFILPPSANCQLLLHLTMNNGDIYELPLSTPTFKSGFQYTCNLTGVDTSPGIRTEEDLIAFSLFINGKAPEREWSDFGYSNGKDTIYRLLNDITLTPEGCRELLPIGYYESKAFQHTFDGEGHTISNLIIPDKSINSKVEKYFSGLFGLIGKNGVVKNLHIDQAQCNESPICQVIGAIAGKNTGIIINCSVKNSTFHSTAKENLYIGSICGKLSQGYIINSSSINNLLYSKSYCYTGGLAAEANGYVLNSFAYNNQFFTNNCTGSYNGGLIGNCSPSLPLTVSNCYTFQPTIPSNYWGAAIGLAQYISIDNFMYNKGNLYNKKTGTKTNINNTYQYDNQYNTTTNIPIHQILNNWIDSIGKSNYPNITFKRWKIAEDSFVTFE